LANESAGPAAACRVSYDFPRDLAFWMRRGSMLAVKRLSDIHVRHIFFASERIFEGLFLIGRQLAFSS
jgi:hypothetical protein